MRMIFYGAVVAIVFGWSEIAAAALISGGAYEPFDYPAGSTILAASNLNGGSGWNTTGNVNAANDADANWGNAIAIPAAAGTNKTVVSPTLSSTAIGYPAATGGKATIDATNATTGVTTSVARNLKQTIDSGTFYFSYLTNKNNDTQRTTNLGFFGPAVGTTPPGNQVERVSFGQIGTNAAGATVTNGNFGMIFNNVNPAGVVANTTSPIAYGVGVTHLIVGRIDWNPTGNETVTMWVDPADVTSEAAAGAPYLASSAYELTSINSIRLFSGATAGTFTSVSADYDEIRVGGTWAAAVAVPEPGSLMLVACSGLLLVARRRTGAL